MTPLHCNNAGNLDLYCKLGLFQISKNCPLGTDNFLGNLDIAAGPTAAYMNFNTGQSSLTKRYSTTNMDQLIMEPSSTLSCPPLLPFLTHQETIERFQKPPFSYIALITMAVNSK